MTLLADSRVAAPTTIAVEAATHPTRGQGTARRAASSLAYALASMVLLVGVWWLAVLALGTERRFVARAPNDVWHYLTDPAAGAAHRSIIYHGAVTTVRDAFLGLAVGIVAALIGAILFTLSKVAQETFMPMAMVLQSVPLVALVPLIALVVGRSTAFVAIVASIVTFFPALVNVSLATRNAPAQSMDLVYAYGGGKWARLRRVQFPYALPALFASLRIAAPLALIGALLAEWLGTSAGLGGLMLHGPTDPALGYNVVWACAALVTLFSVVLYGVISAVEAAVLARFAPLAS